MGHRTQPTATPWCSVILPPLLPHPTELPSIRLLRDEMILPILPVCTRAPGRRGGDSNYNLPSNTHTHALSHTHMCTLTHTHTQTCRRAWTKLSLLHRQGPLAPFLLSPGVNRQPWPFIQAIMVCDRRHSSLAVSCPARDALFSVRIQSKPLAWGKERLLIGEHAQILQIVNV